MATQSAAHSAPPVSLLSGLDHAPFPMAMLEGAMHTVRYINPAFSRLIDKTSAELLGKPFVAVLPGMDGCLAPLDRVYRTGASESHTERDLSVLHSGSSSWMMWPLMAREGPAGVMIQVIEPSPLREKMIAMNEALLLGSVRQHELTAVADASNLHLQVEMRHQKEREHDALMMTSEISHRMKNNLQTVVNLIAHEAKRAPPPCVDGYTAMQSRIMAIAELYDLMSRSGQGGAVSAGPYLGEIARALSASLLGTETGIKIEVSSDEFDIDPVRAVPFGLLVNELVTNAVKHAFPVGKGLVTIRVERRGDEIELFIVDNGVGLKDKNSAPITRNHGSDYVTMFVRQLRGSIAVSTSEETGTNVRIRLPALVA